MGWMPAKADVLKVWGSTCVCRVRFADWLTELLQKFSNFPSRKNLDSPCLRRGLGICIVDKTLVKSHGQEVSKPLPIPQALTFPSTLRPPTLRTPSPAKASVTPRTIFPVEPRAYLSMLLQGEASQASLGCGII